MDMKIETSMERGICPIAVLYVLFNLVSLLELEPLFVNKCIYFTTALYCRRLESHDVIGHVTIRQFPISDPLTSISYLVRFYR